MNSDHETTLQDALRSIFGELVSDDIVTKRVPVGTTGTYVEPDAVVVSEDLVIEIESRTAKQIRGAIMDLLLSPQKKKLLIVRPNGDDVAGKKTHFEAVLAARLRSDESSAVVLLAKEADPSADQDAIRQGLAQLGINV